MTITQICKENGIILSRDNMYLRTVSPFSDSRLPLLYIDEENDTFTDFSTGLSGNNVDFAKNLLKISSKSAEKYVNEDTQKSDRADEVLYDICESAYEYYKGKIKNSPAYEYLENRGFNSDDIEKFGFGYANNYGNSLYRYLHKNYDKDDILKSGVCKVKDGKVIDVFWKRVIIPIKNSDGKVVAFGGRVLDDGTPKYINSPETPIFHKREILYGYDTAKNIDCNAYILCEGYMDCISLHKNGLTNAVASLGTALSKEQCELLSNKRRVYVLYDTDTAGISAAKKAIPMLEFTGINTKVIDYSACKDPDEYLKTYGIDAFRGLFKEPKEGEKYLMEKLLEEDIEKAVIYLSNKSVKKIINIL